MLYKLQELFWNNLIGGPFWGIAAVVVFILFVIVLKIIIKVTLPDHIIVVNGRKVKKAGRKFGFKVERGRTNVTPYIEDAQYLNLGIMPINVRVEGVNSANGITVGADATACVCIDDDNEAMLYQAVERLLGKTRREIQEQIQQTLVGNFRGALNKTTPLQAIGMAEIHDTDDDYNPESSDRAIFRNELLKDIDSDLSSFGMKVVSVSLQKIWDTSNYIANLAQKSLATKRQEVEIQEAKLNAKAEKEESDANRRMIVAKNEADEKIIAARQKLEMYRRESSAQIQQATLEAKNATMEATNKGMRAIQEKKVELRKLENVSDIILEADAKEKAAELIAAGEGEAVSTREDVKNKILKQKMQLLEKSGNTGKMILFLQKLHHLFEAYEKYAKGLNVDSLVIMDDKKGFNGAVNRGPSAFVDFLQHFDNGLGINVKDLLAEGSSSIKGAK
jgi:uncharacterized membrane protein YqiK